MDDLQFRDHVIGSLSRLEANVSNLQSDRAEVVRIGTRVETLEKKVSWMFGVGAAIHALVLTFLGIFR